MEFRGVNLGGWLLLERGPSYPLFESCGSDKHDEWHLCEDLRSKNMIEQTLDKHRETFITENDFKKMSQLHINSVRLPFGYWLCDSDGPYYIGKGLFYYVDKVIAWCKKYNIRVLLDLHGAPGGESNGAPCGHLYPEWKSTQWNKEKSIQIIKHIAEKYINEDAVIGIQVCNEPAQTIPMPELFQFYLDTIATLNEINFRKKIILPVFSEWRLDEFFNIYQQYISSNIAFHIPQKYNINFNNNIVIDLHYYHCFGDIFQNMTYDQHKEIMLAHEQQIKEIQKRNVQVYIGEWSCAINHVTDAKTFFNDQLAIYNSANGYFFWNWKDGNDGWSLEEYIKRNSS